tara:strand:+ start:421 stop:609 length:189 start_codon:yes stop_codon:yes gene_type:complete
MSDLDDRLRIIESDVKKIMTNELPHITNKLSALSANQKWLTTITLVILTAVFAGIIQTAFFK